MNNNIICVLTGEEREREGGREEGGGREGGRREGRREGARQLVESHCNYKHYPASTPLCCWGHSHWTV